MKSKLLYLFLFTIMLTSCGAYKKYQPVDSVPENLYGIHEDVLSDSTIALIPWREFFTDPKLQNLIDTALCRNTDLKVAMLRTEQATAVLEASKLAYIPSLNLGAEGGLSKVGDVSSKSYNINLLASWEVDIFGRLTAAKRGALASVVSAHDSEQAIKTRLIATVATSYYSLLMLDRQIEIAKETLSNWDETIRVMELLKQAGRSNETGILQIKGNRTGLEADITTMEKSRKDIENSICALLMKIPSSIERGKMSETYFSERFPIGFPIQILANRPDVRAAEMELARTHYAVGAARAEFYPSLTLNGVLGFTNSGGIVTNPGQWLMNAVGSLIQPIFNRGQLIANYKISQAEREIAFLNFNQALINAGNEVNNALNQIDYSRKRFSLIEEQSIILEETVTKTELLMKHSPVSYLEVLTAQQSLLGAKQAEVECRYEEVAGIINLYQALGGGCR